MTVSQDHLSGPERILVEAGEEYSKLQLHLDKIQRVRWIENLAPWRVMATFTFRWQAGIFSAQRCFEKTMRRRLPGVSYYEAIEANPGRDGYHVHSLWADCETVFRKEEWCHWLKRYGRARIEPVRSHRDVADYASKYLAKGDCWWNVRLQWHRLQEISGAAFSLIGSRGSVPGRPP